MICTIAFKEKKGEKRPDASVFKCLQRHPQNQILRVLWKKSLSFWQDHFFCFRQAWYGYALTYVMYKKQISLLKGMLEFLFFSSSPLLPFQGCCKTTTKINERLLTCQKKKGHQIVHMYANQLGTLKSCILTYTARAQIKGHLAGWIGVTI